MLTKEEIIKKLREDPGGRVDGLALFSGGLDSILAARLLQEQGLRVLCLHFVSPFFGFPERVGRWSKLYGLSILAVDIGEPYVAMLKDPAHGYGKVLNPCVDCKILMLRHAREIMEGIGASFIATGEVLGQRPMSQRRDTLNIIRRDTGLKEFLLRPLCAKLMDPTRAELEGLVDRERLLSFSGRGRKDQLELAARYGLKEVPTPGGGCLLTEKESARSYWPVLQRHPAPGEADFRLARTGRQYWSVGHASGQDALEQADVEINSQTDGATPSHAWLAVGRNQADNAALTALAIEGDFIFKVAGYPGPIALGRQFPGLPWSRALLESAAAFTASFSPKAMRDLEDGAPFISVHIRPASGGREAREVKVAPATVQALRAPWAEYSWESAREEKREGKNKGSAARD